MLPPSGAGAAILGSVLGAEDNGVSSYRAKATAARADGGFEGASSTTCRIHE